MAGVFVLGCTFEALDSCFRRNDGGRLLWCVWDGGGLGFLIPHCVRNDRGRRVRDDIGEGSE